MNTNIFPSSIISSQIAESLRIRRLMLEDQTLQGVIKDAADRMIETYRAGHKTLWAGNGGSAADAQHMVGELVNKFCIDRPGLPAMALTVDSSVMTSIGNDFSFDRVFARQIEACAVPGDMFIAISTSGNSKNLVEALASCRERGVTTLALVGSEPCALDACDLVIHVPSRETPRIQECHTLIGHLLCYLVEQALFG